jgi:hypothetical protein
MRALASAAVCAEVALREGGEGGGHALRGGIKRQYGGLQGGGAYFKIAKL